MNGCRAGPAEDLVIKSYKKLIKGKEKAVQSHKRTMKTKSETEQLLELSNLRKVLRRQCPSAGELALEYQRTIRKETVGKAAANLKVERDLDKFKKRTEELRFD